MQYIIHLTDACNLKCKYCYENNLNGFDNANLYEYRKIGWNEDVINDYRGKYFFNYVKNKPAKSSQAML